MNNPPTSSSADWLGPSLQEIGRHTSIASVGPASTDPLGTEVDWHARVIPGQASGATMVDTDVASTPAAPWPELPDFEIIGELGRGGMGVVYIARQRRLDRQVAVKMLPGAAAVDQGALQRLRTEASALARLHHPNILQIHDVGEHAGMPFCVLELVAGGSLDQLLHGKPQDPQRSAHLVAVLARAMQAAHDLGIVHRDLKPSNILMQAAGATVPSALDLSGDWTPKIADFGLAKHLDDANPTHTATGAIVGTPCYMAPEQASGGKQATTSSVDIYALGAILYELLTGRPPFQGVTAVDVLQQVVAADPIPPAQLQPKVPRDLATICLKCLHKDPAKRYASAAALAEDLDRFLAEEPIHARPAGWTERAWKWGRRHPGLAVALAAGVLLVVLVSGGSVALALAWRGEAQARDAAQDQRDEALRQREHAKANLALAHRSVDQTIHRLLEHDRLRQEDFSDLRRELLESCLPFLQEFIAQRGDLPELRAQQANAQARLSQLRGILQDWPAAERDALRACQQYDELMRDFPTRKEFRFDRAGNFINLAGLYSAMGRQRDAVATYARAAQAWDGEIQANPADRDAPRIRAMIDYSLAGVYSHEGQMDLAVDHYQRCLARLEPLLQAHPEDAVCALDAAKAYTNLGLMHQQAGRLDQAEPCYLSALRIKEDLAARQANRVESQHMLAICLLNVGNLRRDQKRWAEARESYQRSRALLENVMAKQPGNPRPHEDYLKAMVAMAAFHQKRGQRALAVEHLEAGLRVGERLRARFPGRWFHAQLHADVLARRVSILSQGNQVDRTRDAYEGYDRFLKQALQEFPHERVEILMRQAEAGNDFGLSLMGKKLLEDAGQVFEQALQSLDELEVALPSRPDGLCLRAAICCNLAHTLADRHQRAAALSRYSESIAAAEAVLRESPANEQALRFLANAVEGRARVYEREKAWELAAADWDRRLTLNRDASRELHYLAKRALAKVRTGDLQAWQGTEPWLKNPTLPGLAYFDLARLHALTAEAAKDDETVRHEHLKRAMDLLRHAQAKQFFSAAAQLQALDEHDDLKSVRATAEFRAWRPTLNLAP
jgi:tetratricopeptide (TPR) repeat protein